MLKICAVWGRLISISSVEQKNLRIAHQTEKQEAKRFTLKNALSNRNYGFQNHQKWIPKSASKYSFCVSEPIYIYISYLLEYTLIKELLQFLIAVVDAELFKTVHLEIFWKTRDHITSTIVHLIMFHSRLITRFSTWLPCWPYLRNQMVLNSLYLWAWKFRCFMRSKQNKMAYRWQTILDQKSFHVLKIKLKCQFWLKIIQWKIQPGSLNQFDGRIHEIMFVVKSHASAWTEPT